ncbi:STAS domain-containing protein [Kitasatospora sp. NPDC094015]|uniref:STAS domain-containing protein n=1 Tax=Kitasatospora sp. NPDC094015 TaxID=3155205 RepID=UPI003328D81A
MTEDPSTTPPGPSHPSGPAGRLSVAVVPGLSRHLARLVGEIDMDVAADLRETLERALADAGTGLDLDMSGVTFCDSFGLNTLLRLRLSALRSGRTLVIVHAGPQLAKLLSLTETTALFTAPLNGSAAAGGAGPAGREPPYGEVPLP